MGLFSFSFKKMIERTSALVDIVKKTQAAHRENVFTFGGTEL